MSLKLYYDLMSQPSRALYILLKHINYDFTKCPVDLRSGNHFGNRDISVLFIGNTGKKIKTYLMYLNYELALSVTRFRIWAHIYQRQTFVPRPGMEQLKAEILPMMFFYSIPEKNIIGQHYSDEYTKLNRFQKVPLIDYNGFILSESVAMMGFLSRENIISDDLYPRDSKTHAKVEEYLLWHQIGLRLHCAMYFRVVFFSHFDNKEEMSKKVNPYKKRMTDALDIFDTKWLGRGNQFLIGDKPTVADLIAATEIEQPRMAGYDPTEHYDNIRVWMAKVREHFNPHYDEAHVILNKIVKKNALEMSKL